MNLLALCIGIFGLISFMFFGGFALGEDSNNHIWDIISGISLIIGVICFLVGGN